ncbi:hypothetical protein CXR25_02435 [Brevibacterium aurantiacum]|nr:hypothetical protein CXR25_02435 [Brevibacterium aurantiacum]
MTIAWFSDDPVYFSGVYSDCAPNYDIVLHTGGPGNLQVYRDELGLSNGIEFPFWTDQIEHPRVDMPSDPLYDFLFLGNMHDAARVDRVSYLAGLGDSVAIFGKTAPEEKLIKSLGFLNTQEEFAAVARLSKFSLTFSQQMATYAGSEYESVATRQVAEFPVPSRIVQSMAMGMPVVSRDWTKYSRILLPNLVCAGSAMDALALSSESSVAERAQIANANSSWQKSHYSARSRALFLLDLINDTNWSRWTIEDRATAFLDSRFDGGFDADAKIGSSSQTVAKQTGPHEWNLKVALVGTGWTLPDTLLSRIKEMLLEAGAAVIDINPYDASLPVVPDYQNHYIKIFDLESLGLTISPDLVVIVGDGYGVRVDDSTKVFGLIDNSVRVSRRLTRKAEDFSAIGVSHLPVLETLHEMGYRNVHLFPGAVSKKRAHLGSWKPEALTTRLAIVYDRMEDVETASPWLRDEEALRKSALCVCDIDTDPDVVVVVPDLSGSEPRLPLKFWQALDAGAGLVVFVRYVSEDSWIVPFDFLPEVGSAVETSIKLSLYRNDAHLMKSAREQFELHVSEYDLPGKLLSILRDPASTRGSSPTSEVRPSRRTGYRMISRRVRSKLTSVVRTWSRGTRSISDGIERFYKR